MKFNSISFLVKIAGFLSAILIGIYIPHATAQDTLTETISLNKTGITFSGDSITGEYTRPMTYRCGRDDGIWCWKPAVNKSLVQPEITNFYPLDPSGDLTLSATRYAGYEHGRGLIYRVFHYAFNPARPRLDGKRDYVPEPYLAITDPITPVTTDFFASR